MKPYIDDGDVTLYHGDAIAVLQGLPDGIAQTCITSPPYWGLRDYGTGTWTGGDPECDHMDTAFNAIPQNREGRETPGGRGGSFPTTERQFKGACGKCGAQRTDDQLGLETTPTLYVDRLVAVFAEVRRVLRDDGTLWLNLGDSYTANGGGGESRMIDLGKPSPNAVHASRGHGQTSGLTGSKRTGLKPKDLVGIPWRVAFALQTDGWYLRSDIIWAKPNPMPESVTDRPTKAHEYVFLFSKQPRYYYDADAIREAAVYGDHARTNDSRYHAPGQVEHAGLRRAGLGGGAATADGRNRRSVWTIQAQPFPEAHFATYPEALVRPCVQAGSSYRGECVECGAPWRRTIRQAANVHPGDSGRNDVQGEAQRGKRPDGKAIGTIMRERHEAGRGRETIGWEPSCTCLDPSTGLEVLPPGLVRPQTVLDPFVGSGTTARVARNLGRRCIGIDLSAEYLAIAAKRTSQLSLLGGGS